MSPLCFVFILVIKEIVSVEPAETGVQSQPEELPETDDAETGTEYLKTDHTSNDGKII